MQKLITYTLLAFGIVCVGLLPLPTEPQPPQPKKCTYHAFRQTVDSVYYEVACPRGVEP